MNTTSTANSHVSCIQAKNSNMTVVCVQLEKLKTLVANAHLNGATDVRWMSMKEAQTVEPDLHCLAALYSPSTGIVDGKQ